MRRKGSRNVYYQGRVPGDVRPFVADGLKLAFPIGEEFVAVTVSPATRILKVSLRTSDPAEGKIRNAKAAVHIEGVWRGLRAGIRPDGAVALTHKQAVALAGRLYRAWANGEGRERSVGMVRVPVGPIKAGEAAGEWKWVPESEPVGREGQDWQAEVWRSAKEHLEKVAALEAKHTGNSPSPLERAFGVIIDKLSLSEGMVKITPESRELLLGEFHRAMLDAVEKRQRNAAGDYSPDPKSERFPEFQRPQVAALPRPSPDRRPEVPLSGLLEAWWKENKAANRSPSTYESYERALRQLEAFLEHDDAQAVTADDVRRFKDHRIAGGRSLKTVKDSDIAALKSVFGWGVGNGLLAANPAEGVKVVAPKKVRVRSPEFTTEEARALLRHARDYKPANKRIGARMAAAKRWVRGYAPIRARELVRWSNCGKRTCARLT